MAVPDQLISETANARVFNSDRCGVRQNFSGLIANARLGIVSFQTQLKMWICCFFHGR